MISGDDLKQLASLVGGTVEEFDGLVQIEWSNGSFSLRSDEPEAPAECFDLLDRMEAKGLNTGVKHHSCNDCYLCWIEPSDIPPVRGTTRTEAIVRLFLEVMKP